MNENDGREITHWELDISQRVMAYALCVLGVLSLVIIIVGVVIKWL